MINIKDNPVLFCIKCVNSNKYLNSNWRKRMVPLTIDIPYFYTDIRIVNLELMELKEFNKINNENFKIITYFTITEEQYNKINTNEHRI